ncbi:MAG: hypothetical protein IPL79_10050 [Myxococcales bacterium]|nr:hypothetical protein [Myxococcales bacterium]
MRQTGAMAVRWYRMLVATHVLGLVAGAGSSCDRQHEAPRAAAPPGPAASAPLTEPRCTLLPFAASAPVAEASGAVVLPEGDILVVGDSGTDGAFALLRADSGETLQVGALPLGKGASDDLEGLTLDGGKLVAITSSGWIRVWRIGAAVPGGAAGFELADGPYPIAPVTPACPGEKVNCGGNYEGLCLRHGEAPSGACAGFAAAKATNQLVCLVRKDGRLALDPSRTIALPGKQAVSGCDFDPADQAVFVGMNAFGAFAVYRITAWDLAAGPGKPGAATATQPLVDRLGPLGAGFPEAIAVAAGGLVYRFSDTSSAPSQQWKFHCR